MNTEENSALKATALARGECQVFLRDQGRAG